jgi:hypothetical protein
MAKACIQKSSPSPKSLGINMRKRMGNITYNKSEQVMDDPVLEEARQVLVKEWRRENSERRGRKHLKRIVREDGIAQSITEIFSRDGRPPVNVNIAKMVRMYNKVDMQWSWIDSIIAELNIRLRELNVARFLKDKEARQRRRHDLIQKRESNFLETMQREDTGEVLPTKVRALVLEAIAADSDRSAAKRAIKDPFLSGIDISHARQIGEMLNYIFFDHILEEDRTISDDLVEHYDVLDKALAEFEIMRSDLEVIRYDLREFIESADALVMSAK